MTYDPCIFEMWKQTLACSGNSCSRRENVRFHCRPGLNPSDWSCEAEALLTPATVLFLKWKSMSDVQDGRAVKRSFIFSSLSSANVGIVKVSH